MDVNGNRCSTIHCCTRNTKLKGQLMQRYQNLKIIITALLVFLGVATTTKAGDVSLRIPESSMNNLFEAIVYSKWFNYGAVGSGNINYYNVKMNAVNIDVEPNNNFSFSFDIKAKANFNILIWGYSHTSDGTLEGSGELVIVPVGEGYKITFDIQSINYSSNDWYAGLFNTASKLAEFLGWLPEISTSSQQPLLPTSIHSYFTSATPTLSTTSNEIILSYDLSAGPRYITAFNEVNGDRNIGQIENTTGGEENIHPSPHTFEWYSGSQKSIRTPLEILEPQPENYYKFRNWLA